MGRTGPFQIGLGDLDGDGDLDAVFANTQQNHSQVWLNDGRGNFTDTGQELTQYGHGVGLADWDGDGDLDIFINCHQFVRPSAVYLNDGQANFQPTGQDLGDANISGAELNMLDLDGDGNTDVHVMYYDPNGLPDKVYLGDGAGAFRDSGLALDEQTIAWGDLDGDGDTDYFGKRWGVGYVVQLNDGGGQFSPGWQLEDGDSNVGGVALADLDNDGDLDALVANGFRQTGGRPSRLFWNDGSGQFTDSGQVLNKTIGAELAVGDLDGDGDLDVFVSNMDLPNELWLNDGNGQLLDSGLRLEGSMSARPTLGDVDGDGDLDVFVGSLGGRAELWLNTLDAQEGQLERNDLFMGQAPLGLDVQVFAPGIVSIEQGKEYKIAFSPDMQELFFTRRTPGERDDRLWYSRLENGKLTQPELAPFAYDSLESDACFSPDGSRLYFNSWRPLPGEQALSERHNLWFVDKTGQGWGEPQLLDSPISEYRPVYFSIADDGTMYFTCSSPRAICSAELQDGQYLDVQTLPQEINFLADVAHPAIAPDESYIVVDSYQQRGSDLIGSLYVSFKKADGSWTEAVSLREALKASETDVYASPRVSPDGKYLFFENYIRETDQADIYWVSTDVIQALRPPELQGEAALPASTVSVDDVLAQLQGLPLDEFFEQSFRQLLLRDPDDLVWRGLAEEYGIENDRFSDLSEAYTHETQGLESAVLDLLRGYDREALSPEQQLSYDIYAWYLDDLVRGHEFAYYDYPVNSMSIASVDFLILNLMVKIFTINAQEDAQDYVARLAQFDVWMEQLLQGLAIREQAGVIPPQLMAQQSLDQVRGHVRLRGADPFERIELYTSFRDKLEQIDGLSQEEKQSLLAAARTEIEETVVPAYLELRDYMVHLVDVASDDTPGLARLDRGQEYYAYLLRHHTTTGLSADEIHQLGLAEVQRLQAEMKQTAHDQLGYPLDISMQELSERFWEESHQLQGEALLAEFQRLRDGVKEISSDYFIFPQADLAVEFDPVASVNYYLAPAADGSRPGTYFATAGGMPSSLAPVVFYHEAIPGHHLENALGLELDLPAFRKLIGNSAYSEGWALYAERLAWEMGLFEGDAPANLGRLQMELIRAARLVVDTGLNHQGWSWDEATDFMNQAIGMDYIPESLVRFITLPGQGCAYTVGYLKLMELRQRAMDQLGAEFDIREFHNVVLGHGNVPLDILERIVDDWIAGKL